MATVTITIDDPDLPRLVQALCVQAGVPVSAANAENALAAWLTSTLVAYEVAAQQAALQVQLQNPIAVTPPAITVTAL